MLDPQQVKLGEKGGDIEEDGPENCFRINTA